jgi:putative salt-induced outer membrane protein YdiY
MLVRIAIALMICSFGAGVLWADQVTLKNGDRVTGSIVKEDGGRLTIASVNFGAITMNWADVDTLTTDMPAYVQVAGQTESATLSASGGQVTLAPPSGPARVVAAADIQAIRDTAEQAAYDRMLAPTWLELWSGTSNLGFAGAAGNARTTTFTFGANAARATRTDKTSLYFNAVTASALVSGANTLTARAVRGGWAYQRNITPRLFGNVFNDWDHDRFQSLDLRFVLGAGGGYHAVNTDRTQFDLLAGLNYQHAKFSTPLTQNDAEFNWGDQFNRKLNHILTITQSYRMFNSITQSPDYRVNFDIGSTARLAQWLNWNLSISDRFLSDPVPGRLRNDVIYSTGLGLKFGNP